MGRGSAPSEGGRVGWDGGRRCLTHSHPCRFSTAQGKGDLWQTSAQGCLLGLTGTTGNGPVTASVTPQGTTPCDFPSRGALGTAALAQRCRASRDYLFTVFLEQLQAARLCLQCTNPSSIHKAHNPQRQEKTVRRCFILQITQSMKDLRGSGKTEPVSSLLLPL